jgi:MoaA/NifB/PqqE/SkfB family radical SAM enzyme
MSKNEIFDMLNKADEVGMIRYIAWGGEPLLREDLPDILKFARKLGLYTELVTNGMYLKNKYNEIAPFTNHISVSIDAPDEQHDNMRGVKGLFDNAIEGIKEVKKQGNATISICSVISKLNLDNVDGVIHLSTNLGIPVNFEPMVIFPGYNEELMPNKRELKEVYSKILFFKKSGFPILNSRKYLEIMVKDKTFTCHVPRIFLEVNARGDSRSCLDDQWGNIKDTSFEEIFQSEKYREFIERAKGCTKCNVTCIIENSLLYSFNLEVLMERLKYIT